MDEKSYEQARERVAVPTREEIAAGLSTAYQASELNADEALEFDDIPEAERQRHLWMADYVLTLLRQAPSAQGGAFTDRGEPGVAWSVLERWKTDFYAQLGRADSLERDLAAERAAHQTTKADCERRMNDWQDTHEQEVEQLKDDLAAERAAHEATRKQLATAQACFDSHEVSLQAAEKRAAELERERDEAREQLGLADERRNVVAEQRDRLQLEMVEERDETERVRGLLAEALKSEAALQAKLEALIASVVAVTREAPNVNSAWLAGEIRKLCTSALAQESAKPAEPQSGDDRSEHMRVVREPGTGELLLAESPKPGDVPGMAVCDPRFSAEWPMPIEPAEPKRFVHEPDCMQPDNHDCACPSPAAEPKPGDEHRCKIDAPAYLNKCECGATLNDLFDKHRIAKPAEPEPGDVLSGEAAKAYMLANPGRRVRDSRWQRSWYAAVDGVVKTGDGVHTWGPADAFHGDMGEYAHARYIVLPPEPAKPATPDLGLAAVTVRVDELELTALQLLERVTKLEGK